MLEQKADREDLLAPLEQLTQAIERLHGVSCWPTTTTKLTSVNDPTEYPGS